MSLSSHLRHWRRSPVGSWIGERFPATQIFARDANRELCKEPAACPLRGPEGSDLALVGTAADYLIRACLQARALEDTIASRTATRMDELSRIDDRAGRAERQAVARIRTLRPSRRKLTDPEWRELCRLCLFLARLEQWFRTGAMNLALFDLFLQPLMGWDGKELGDLVESTMPPAAVEDLERVGRAAIADQRPLTRLRPLILNPTFAISVELGGADADLIAGDTLIDWKSTSQRPVGREQLWAAARLRSRRHGRRLRHPARRGWCPPLAQSDQLVSR